MAVRVVSLIELGVYAFAIPIVICHILALAGCTSTSPGIPGIYLLSVKGFPNTSITEVRLNYFGICVFTDTGAGAAAQCAATAGQNSTGMATKFNLQDDDPVALRKVFERALSLQKRVPPCLLGGSVLFLIGVGFLLHLKRADRIAKATAGAKAPSTKWTMVVFASATAFTFAAALEVLLLTMALEASTAPLVPKNVFAKRSPCGNGCDHVPEELLPMTKISSPCGHVCAHDTEAPARTETPSPLSELIRSIAGNSLNAGIPTTAGPSPRVDPSPIFYMPHGTTLSPNPGTSPTGILSSASDTLLTSGCSTLPVTAGVPGVVLHWAAFLFLGLFPIAFYVHRTRAAAATAAATKSAADETAAAIPRVRFDFLGRPR